MIIYRNDCNDPYYNLAAEEYLLNSKNESIFMLWRNSDAVIIGKNQNAYAELDIEYAKNNNIKVVRRLTGGGAVFHDKGNVNFTFIVPGEENATLDFERFTRPVIEAITALGVENAGLSGRNDIMIGGSKVSGNAQSSYNGKTLHHGCLLYSADLSRLAGVLRVDPEKIRAKGIKSVRNRVSNIADHLPHPMSATEFMAYLEDFAARTTGAEIRELTHEDKVNIRRLADTKYSTWEWNYGRSKEYAVTKKKRYPFGSVEISLVVDGGVIRNIEITGDFFGMRDVSALEDLVKGVRFDRDSLSDSLNGFSVESCIAGMDGDTFVSLLMS